MNLIDNLNAIIPKGFYGELFVRFSDDDPIGIYRLFVNNGHIVFANDDLKEHFTIAYWNQNVESITFNRIKKIMEGK